MTTVAGDIVRITAGLKFLATEDIQNVYHIRVTTVGSGGDAGLMNDVENVLDPMYFALRAIFNAALTSDAIYGQNLTQNTLLPQEAWDTFVAGTSAAQADSPQVAGLVVFPTGLAGVQGRKYIGPVAEDFASAGGIVAGTVTLLENQFVNLIGVVVGANGWQFEFGVYRNSDGRFTPYASVKVIPNTRTQRRRTQGFGS